MRNSMVYPALLATLFSFSCAAPKNVSRQALLKEVYAQLDEHTGEFNGYEGRPASDGPFHTENNLAFLRENIPVFICSDPQITKVYNYRWWMISKHLKEYQDTSDHQKYWVITEFFGVKPWASLSGAITCPAGHQFYDVRWLRDPQYLRSYADYFMRGSASRLNQRENANFLTYLSRPESHHFSSWMINGVEALLKIHPDPAWMEDLLPHLEKHQHVWDSLFTVQNPQAKTYGMYKILDLYDGMEFSLSAVLGLIASEGAYAFYTPDTWKDYYLGWGTTARAAQTAAAQRYPRAFHSGYPDFYLVRPSVNAYMYGNLKSLARLFDLSPRLSRKAYPYHERARKLQQQVLGILWNPEDRFFNTLSAGDNAYGARDFEARVRESVGYTPWYFGLIPKEGHETYAPAWQMLGSEQGFMHEKGMTTAERAHSYYNEQAYAWNGRGWPFQNSVVNKAFGNYLRQYKQTPTPADRQLLFTHIQKLAALHGPGELNIGEWYIPSDGAAFGGEKDYFHSTFPDMIIEDLLGFSASHENSFSLHPLVPEGAWEYFFLGNLRYHGHDIDIAWKKEGKTNSQARLYVWIDGELRVNTADKVITVPLARPQ